MTRPFTHTIDPKLDLVFERTLDVRPELVWAAWTMPEHIVKWFTPAPWKTIDCQIDLRPGGLFHTTMQSPEGQNHPNVGCFLEIVPNEKLVWTNALLPGYRPAPQKEGHVDFLFTAVLTFEPQGKGTKYKALVIHRDEEGRKNHEQLGFHNGWGKATDQLVEAMKQI